jgi:hypothetical protein
MLIMNTIERVINLKHMVTTIGGSIKLLGRMDVVYMTCADYKYYRRNKDLWISSNSS